MAFGFLCTTLGSEGDFLHSAPSAPANDISAILACLEALATNQAQVSSIVDNLIR